MFTAVEMPTTSIYFTSALGELIGHRGDQRKPIWRIGANVFYVRGRTLQVLVSRTWEERDKRRLQRLPTAEIRYLLDDDIWAGADDPNLPRDYREKLRVLADGPVQELLHRASSVYAPSPVLLDRLGAPNPVLVRPALVEPVAELAHHDDSTALLELLFAGTRSHLTDLCAISDDLARFLRSCPQARLHTFLGKHTPDLLRLPNAIHHHPLSWPAYRRLMRRRRFHIALAPCLPTAFNTARSVNKMLEHACFGAAPIYGDCYVGASTVIEHGAGLLCTMSPGVWYETLCTLAKDRARLRALAAANRDLAFRIGDRAELRSFWLREFGLDG